MTKKIFAVVNPVAGDGASLTAVKQALADHFPTPAWQVEIYETTGEEHMSAVVQRGLDDGCDWVLAAGGDGTVSEVADGLVHTDMPLGIIPLGTANNLAQSLDIPREADAACELLAGETKVRKLDVIQVGEQYFVLQLGVGIDALMAQETSREAKNRWGVAAYLKTAVQQAIGFQPRRFTITTDGIPYHLRATEVMVANAPDVGVFGLKWGEHIRPDDGAVDICVIRAKSVADYVTAVWHMIRGQQQQASHIRFLQARDSFTIEADEPLPWQGDGELVGKTAVSAKVQPRALEVLVRG